MDMEYVEYLIGHGEELTVLQMSIRALLIFIVALLLIRISGKRSFGMRMPLDNVITILLGAILSRAVVGASPFLPTIAASATIVLFHRLLAWLGLYSDFFGKIVKGESELLYKGGAVIEKNMKSCLVTEKDLMESIHTNANLESLEGVKAIYMERDGQISIIKNNE
jgi:uncharacterized membrane protein YcaP (DUF421 family)